MPSAGADRRRFCATLPKVELHAHLTGSVTKPILQQIWDNRSKEADFRVESPAKALAENTGQDISVFFAHFNTYLYSLISDLSSLLFATRAVLQAFQDDGVVYLELRTTPRAIDSHTAEEVIRSVVGVIEEWNKQELMTTYLILSIDQAKHDTQKAFDIVRLASKLRDEGRPVVGVDLCGDPNNAKPPSTFRPAFQLAKQLGLGIVLHFAEVSASSTREILEEMLTWEPKRLGHVIHVPQEMRKEIRRRGIAVELCLTCNVLAGMLPARGSFADHHFADWWNGSEEPCLSLGTDDVGVFGSMSSEEYRLAAEHFGLSKLDLIKLSRCALKGTLGDTAKANRVLDEFARDNA